jgi:hypothetical protein
MTIWGYLIQQILDEVGMLPQPKTKDKAAPSSIILRRDLDGAPFREKCDYRRVIGKLNFLEKSTRPEIAYALPTTPGSPMPMRSSISADTS